MFCNFKSEDISEVLMWQKVNVKAIVVSQLSRKTILTKQKKKVPFALTHVGENESLWEVIEN